VLFAGEAPNVPEGLDALMPAWAQQLSLLTLLILIVSAFLRGWVVTRNQNQRDIDAERRIADIWKSNFEQSTELNQRLTEALQPVLESNGAILKAVEAVQGRQQAQEERERWLRDRRDPQG
jgi:hypothetical protein